VSGIFRDECVVSVRVPADGNLMLRAWEIRLNAAPDPAQGELRELRIPDEISSEYVVVIWSGAATFSGNSRGPDTCTGTGAPLPVTAVPGGTVIQPDGAEPVRGALLGIDNIRHRIGELRPINHPFADAAIPQGTVQFLLRSLEFDGSSNWERLEPWDRPGFLLSTIDGPRLGTDPPNQGVCNDNELDFVLLPARTPLNLARGEACAPSAFILDFWVEGDRMNPRNLEGGPDQGCKIRCWGSGLSLT